MGCCVSSSCSCKHASPNTVRLVHLNGYVEDLDYPISVSQAIGNPPKQFLCTAAQLLSAGSQPLSPDAPLQPGQLYFVLPFSTLKGDASPLDMAALVKRLTERAKSHRALPETRCLSRTTMTMNGRTRRRETTVHVGVRRSYRVRSWKPILDTIREMSFSRRSESDIQEIDFITSNV
ncbi:hypothetical protein ERO13_A13G209000v2 [Gossypium hirsutum]|uniref:Uncharacterized protein n=5 Tax=Gossypium TaxID=3633 RepID=A0A2P5X8W0_GOSBA|nr:uncharacterized protein LOC107940291 [Gossypium hirsutum]KAB2050196.1 hypothetical protein ES319_A13G228900v1 [Gossypium barbadense]TYG87823.1 hypothetical protein ES288_A13G245600v1 [Gossypium darwinii]TYH93393.1 hypothetical protein ES332_A13G250600v1 [Gossypium tomentosum]TYJ02615.1 hypothetical protein E1A91_A13G241800v1 [Gossypium mustelinum]KAG4167657.1 hypothetical protein ERO13_A13G209000v2 [Gossypium hirsutum]